MLDPTEKIQLIAKKKEFEGCIPHMYLCTAGHVTVGMGHKIENAIEATKVRFLNSDGSLASPENIKSEYEKVKAAKKGRAAHLYEVYTRLHIDQSEIQLLTENHLEKFYKQLKEVYPEFDDYPKNVRFALFDMIYNLGKGGIEFKFKLFTAAVRNRDWAAAADQSSRTLIGENRNQYVAGLLRSEAGISSGSLPQKSQTLEEIKQPKTDAVFPNKKPEPIRVHKNSEIQQNALTIFPKFYSYPLAVQLGIVDMLSTLGVNKLRQQFPKFIRAINNNDWLSASKECSRKNQKPNRNRLVAELFKAGYPGQFKLLIRK